jgi:hypothetical protein
MFAIALVAGKKAKDLRTSRVINVGFLLVTTGLVLLIPVVPRATSGWSLVLPLVIAGSGLGLLVSQLNDYTLAPVSQERVSEAAGVNSAAGSFGLSFGLAFAGAIMLAALSLSFTSMADDSSVLDASEKDRVAQVLQEDAQVMSTTQLEGLLSEAPEAKADEIVRINDAARDVAVRVAIVVPVLAGVIGFLVSLRMKRLGDPGPSRHEGLIVG